ncbi:MAG: hypothetical protein FWD68_17870 [Alphaproteobacteria bacterium]|nr:hypothetical protein [Alphaproteobacteria bacterium]
MQLVALGMAAKRPECSRLEAGFSPPDHAFRSFQPDDTSSGFLTHSAARRKASQIGPNFRVEGISAFRHMFDYLPMLSCKTSVQSDKKKVWVIPECESPISPSIDEKALRVDRHFRSRKAPEERRGPPEFMSGTIIFCVTRRSKPQESGMFLVSFAIRPCIHVPVEINKTLHLLFERRKFRPHLEHLLLS